MLTQNFNVPVTILTKEVPVKTGVSFWTFQLVIFGNVFATGLTLYRTESQAIRAAQAEIREKAGAMKKNLKALEEAET
jgi:uncharacterized protein (DUF2164 family)